MPARAKLRYLRIAPRKVRMVAELIRRKSVVEAENILRFTVKKSARPFLKLLNSAVANAKSGFQMDKENLYIQKVLVDEGPKMKRWLPRARGKADEIQKKTSHITIVLDEIEERKDLRVGRKPEKETENKAKGKTDQRTKKPSGKRRKKASKIDLGSKLGTDKRKQKKVFRKITF